MTVNKGIIHRHRNGSARVLGNLWKWAKEFEGFKFLASKHTLINGGLNQILKRQTFRFHYGERDNG
jgi:hypothetical protein